MATQSPATPPARRVRKRLIIPALLLASIAIFIVWIYWRGTSAQTQTHDPHSAADAVVAQLLKNDGGTFVRCAIVVDAEPAAVWKVVTDYDGQADFLPYASQVSSTRLANGRVRIAGIAHSRIWGDWPFESVVTETEDPEKGEYSINWAEEEHGDLLRNRGAWTLTRLGDGQTVLAYLLEVEVRRAPSFLVRNIIMNRLPSVLRAVRDEVLRRRNG